MQVTEEIRREGPQVLGRFHQPVQHGIGVDLEHPGRGTNAQAFSQAGYHADDQLHWHPSAMHERAMRLQKVACAGGALELAPGSTAGMAVGTQVPQLQPAAITTAPMGTEVHGGIHRAGASMARGSRLGWWRRRRRMGRFMLTPGAMGPLDQSCKRLGVIGSLVSWGLGWRDRLARGSSGGGPEHQEYIHQSHEPELLEKASWYHGHALPENGGRGIF